MRKPVLPFPLHNDGNSGFLNLKNPDIIRIDIRMNHMPNSTVLSGWNTKYNHFTIQI